MDRLWGMESTELSLEAQRSELFETLGGRALMSEVLGIPRSTINNWVSGIPALRVPAIVAFAETQGVRLSTDDVMALSTARRNGG